MLVSNTSARLKTALALRVLKQSELVHRCQPICRKYNKKMGKNDISQYVNGKVIPKQDKLVILAEALNVNEVWLMGYEVPMNEEMEIIDEKGFLEMLDIWLADDDVPIEIKRQALDKLIKYFENEDKAYEK